jgi:GT2 family glycosyltransferase
MPSGHAPFRDGDTPGQSDPLLSIIVPTYNAREVVLRCVESIYSNPPAGPFEVIVVDDASDDGTAEAIRRAYPQVVLLRNELNQRYARSSNRGLRAARGRYLYLLNNDTIMQPGTMDRLIRFLEEHPAVGVVGGKVLNEDGSIQWTVKALPSATTAFFGARSILTRWLPGNRFSRRQLLHWRDDAEGSFTAGYVSGASTMLRRAVLEEVGYLDETFFYLVDADHCKRVWDAGFEVRYLPSAAVMHLNHQGGTMIDSKHRFQSVVALHWGAYRYFRKQILPSVWHPLHAVAVLGLLSRFALSTAVWTLREIELRLPTRLLRRRLSVDVSGKHE